MSEKINGAKRVFSNEMRMKARAGEWQGEEEQLLADLGEDIQQLT